MLYEFAIEPELLTSWDKARTTLNLMGFQHARAISAYPSRKRWKKMIFEACRKAGCADREFARIREKVQQSDAKLVWAGSPEEYDGSLKPQDECWIRNATDRQIKRKAFHAILATRNPSGHPDVVLEADVDESHAKLGVARELPVLRQPKPLAGHIEKLVRNSRVLLLIDPHFDPSLYRWRPVIQACVALAAKGVEDRPLERVEIHTLDADGKCSFEEFRSRCAKHIPGLLCDGLPPVRVCRWRLRESAPDDFHERYVLTDRGGYKLGKGLDEEFGKEQPVALLSEAEHARIWTGFQDETPFFEKDGEITIP
ncbi:MAG: hypothetical protein DYG90_00935 [Chloroflexi bacterium CFX6]|nr:hypothetical protein [Chloroflexi bacterium CFX6]MEB2345220.1 hypothetical protein [Deltaproteobacteria bacterium]